MEPERRDVEAKRLEGHAVISRRELELVEADHRVAHEADVNDVVGNAEAAGFSLTPRFVATRSAWIERWTTARLDC